MIIGLLVALIFFVFDKTSELNSLILYISGNIREIGIIRRLFVIYLIIRSACYLYFNPSNTRLYNLIFNLSLFIFFGIILRLLGILV